MASLDRMVKYLVEKLQVSLAPLEQIPRNQETIIEQNKQIIALLTRLNNNRQTAGNQDQTIPENPVPDEEQR